MTTGSIRFEAMDYGLGLGDVDGDRLADFLLVGTKSSYLISGRDLHSLGNVVDLATDVLPASSWRFKLNELEWKFDQEASTGDLDGDGTPELVLPTAIGTGSEKTRSSYVLSITDLAHLDALDRKADGIIELDDLLDRLQE